MLSHLTCFYIIIIIITLLNLYILGIAMYNKSVKLIIPEVVSLKSNVTVWNVKVSIYLFFLTVKSSFFLWTFMSSPPNYVKLWVYCSLVRIINSLRFLLQFSLLTVKNCLRGKSINQFRISCFSFQKISRSIFHLADLVILILFTLWLVVSYVRELNIEAHEGGFILSPLNLVSVLYSHKMKGLMILGLGGLWVTCSLRDPRFAGSNPPEVGWSIQDIKILSTSPPGGTLSWGFRVWDFGLVKEPQARLNRPQGIFTS